MHKWEARRRPPKQKGRGLAPKIPKRGARGNKRLAERAHHVERVRDQPAQGLEFSRARKRRTSRRCLKREEA